MENKHVCALRSAVTNGQWTNERLHKADLHDNKLCGLCNDGIGSLAHRHVCTVTAEARGRCTYDQECDRFISRLDEGARHLLQTRALLATLDLEGHRPNKDATFVWDLCPRDGVVDPGCTIYTDGSMVDGPTAEIGRVGFGFVAMDEHGIITARAYGTPLS